MKCNLPPLDSMPIGNTDLITNNLLCTLRFFAQLSRMGKRQFYGKNLGLMIQDGCRAYSAFRGVNSTEKVSLYKLRAEVESTQSHKKNSIVEIEFNKNQKSKISFCLIFIKSAVISKNV